MYRMYASIILGQMGTIILLGICKIYLIIKLWMLMWTPLFIRVVYLVLYIFSKGHYIFSKGQQNKSTKMN